jgi:hypothetical protein
MKTMRNALIVSFLLVLMGTSCQKYEDGPLISFRSPEKRLIRKWELANTYKNGYDNFTNNGSFFEFKKNGEFSGGSTDYATFEMKEYTGTWRFVNDKKIIECTGTVHATLGDSAAVINYAISQLRSSDLWLTQNFYSDTVLIGTLDYHYISK